MSIKIRLLLSYIAMTVIPVVLFAVIATTLVSLFFRDGAGMPAFWEMNNRREDLIAGIKFMAGSDPGRFTDSAFLQKTDEQLQQLHAGLAVIRNERLAFVSALVDSPGLLKELSAQREKTGKRGWNNLVDGRYAVDKADIAFGDGSRGTVFVLSDWNLVYETARSFIPLLLLSLLAVIGLTNGILTFLVSRSLIKPLYTLKHAAEQIKDGNLDHKVNIARNDEIGMLGAAFEEMRSRLSESIRLQLQVEENRKQLVSSISHDLKTPITGIKACLEGIRDGIADTGERREKYIGMIARKTDEMDRLIDELMLFSQLDLNKLPFHLEPVELSAYLREFVEEIRMDPRMAGVNIVIERIPEHQPVSVMADREKLRRVIMNIFDNSLKYMDKEKKEICVELDGGNNGADATVSIRDNGPGIESAALPFIFDRFFRGEPSRNRATGGSGLGLAIVKQIVEGLGGKVWAESREGEGMSIYFTLPKAQDGGDRS